MKRSSTIKGPFFPLALRADPVSSRSLLFSSSVQLSTQSPSIFVPPTLDVSVFRLITPSTTSYITYKTGFYTLFGWGSSFIGRRQDQSSLVVGFTSQTQASASKKDGGGGWSWTSEAEVGPADMGLSADWGRKVLGGEIDLKLGGRIGTSEAKGWVSGAKKVTEHVRITVTAEGKFSVELVRERNALKLTACLCCLLSAQASTGITLKIRFAACLSSFFLF